MTSTDIHNLLAAKHSKDIYVPECKTGSTWSGGQLRIMDGWALRKSYTQPLAVCYEIKVNRQDFLRDTKWQEYLVYCNEFYFVCPPELILPGELPPEAGLLWTSKNCKRLMTKKKAVYRKLEIPESLYRYVLFSRVKIVSDSTQENKAEYWRRWMEHKRLTREFGWSVGKAIRETVNKQVHEKEDENQRLRIALERLQDLDKLLKELNAPRGTWEFKRWLAAQRRDTAPVVSEALNQIENIIHNARREIA